jgi:hypothetical protein
VSLCSQSQINWQSAEWNMAEIVSHIGITICERKTGYEHAVCKDDSAVAEFLDTVGYGDGSGLLQQCGRASALQSSGFGRSAP